MASPLPPGSTGRDAARIVFDGCDASPLKRAELGGAIKAFAVANGIAAGGVGILVGFGVTWLVARHFGKAKSP